MNTKIAIIGGGPAGLAAAVSAYDAGVKDLLILERDDKLGGILNQCIHNGFGLHTFKEELTGPEYAERFIEKVRERGIESLLKTIVVDISKETNGLVVTAMSAEKGMFEIHAQSVILAMGCRERPRGALNTPGYRPAGIYSAGTAQRYVNIEGKMPGKEVVILGSGDIGLIMARRMTLEGAHVKAVAELMPYSGGLKRNIVQCLDDFGIPLKLSTTVTDIKGKDRVESVTLSKVDAKNQPIPGTEEEIPCDTLLLSCGLLPENELSGMLGVELSPVTGGATVDESLETSVPGVFACGNVLHVHDLVDYVSGEASEAGKHAAEYVLKSTPETTETPIRLETGNGVRYTVPSLVRPSRLEQFLTVRFRVGSVYKNPEICVYLGDKCLQRRKKQICAPGEMEQVIIKKTDIETMAPGETIRIAIETE
ncbi:MAG: FAD-dependent oxidoreductase [Lachnospiraceae bacterium]|nr:FAD-dependent oxidoreductase [Lachnospiraceae bacterium]